MRERVETIGLIDPDWRIESIALFALLNDRSVTGRYYR